MSQNVVMTGMVLQVSPIGDYDKRVVLLTKEKGKIHAFARGARRPASSLLAATSPFCFGEFELFEGKSSYNLVKANISNFFRDLTMEPEASTYGFYFLEVASYFAQENNDETEMLKLLYMSLRALENPSIPNGLVRSVFELKTLVINGEYPNVFSCVKCGKKEDLVYFSPRKSGTVCEECKPLVRGKKIHLDDTLLYTLQFVIATPVEKLYRFTLKEESLRQFQELLQEFWELHVHHQFRSLQVLSEMFFN